MNNDTTFAVGDAVRSTTNAQGLVRGSEYRVVDMRVRSTFVGRFVTYYVADADGVVLPVGNGHLVLEAVS